MPYRWWGMHTVACRTVGNGDMHPSLHGRFASSIVDFCKYRLSLETCHQMALTSTTRIAWLNNESKLSEEVKLGNLEWCFRPMLVCLRIFGIDFKWNQQRSFVKKTLIRLIGLFWLIIVVATVYGLGVDLYEIYLKEEKKKYEIFSIKIKKSCLIVETGVIYAAFVFSTWKHGQKLVKSFNQIEIHSEIDRKTYHRLRRTIIIAILFPTLMVTMN